MPGALEDTAKDTLAAIGLCDRPLVIMDRPLYGCTGEQITAGALELAVPLQAACFCERPEGQHSAPQLGQSDNKGPASR
jgi:hypothetical protein